MPNLPKVLPFNKDVQRVKEQHYRLLTIDFIVAWQQAQPQTGDHTIMSASAHCEYNDSCPSKPLDTSPP